MDDKQQSYYSAVQAANRCKEMGNEKFKAKEIGAAIDGYGAAIDNVHKIPHLEEKGRDPGIEELASVLYSNRSAAYLAVEQDPSVKYRVVSMFGAADPTIAETVWESEILRSFDKAEGDAASAIKYNVKNPKAHFRLGLAGLSLIERDPNMTDSEKINKLKCVITSLEEAYKLNATAMTKSKIKVAQTLMSELSSLSDVTPFAANIE